MCTHAKYDERIAHILREGVVIPAVPLALTSERKLDERRQRALLRYYAAAGAGGMAVGVHTTQFAIRNAQFDLFEPVLRLASSVMDEIDAGIDGKRHQPLVRIGGICGTTRQAVHEAALLQEAGYHMGLLNVSALHDAGENELADHCRRVALEIPLVGFYLNEAVGGRPLPYSFWRRFAEIENVVAIKIACFNRYKTIDCIRAVVDAGRDDIALYTGNDDHIILDLVTPFRYVVNGKPVERSFVGGLLGQWAVWTSSAVSQLARCHASSHGGAVTREMLTLANEVTAANAVLFDVDHGFAGCIAGLHYVLMRQGILDNMCLLDSNELLSTGQVEGIERVYRMYPHLNDDSFVRDNLQQWLQ